MAKIIALIKSWFGRKPSEAKTVIPTQGWNNEWTEYLRKLIASKLDELNKASDIDRLRPNFTALSRENQIEVICEFIKTLAYYESSFDPNCQNVDVGTKSNKNSWSVGLLQLSVIDQSNLGIRMGYSFEDLLKPLPNLTLGVAILANQISKRGKIFIAKGEKGNPSAYWNPIIIGSRSDRIEKILSVTRALPLNGPIDEIPQHSETPWYDFALNELQKGVSETSHPERVIWYHSFTNLAKSLWKTATSWCSSFVTACLESTGYKSTKSAWARDYSTYGTACKPRKGCILGFERNGPGGDSHVGFFTGKETSDAYEVLGGNQNNEVCYKFYKKSDLLYSRWPVKK